MHPLNGSLLPVVWPVHNITLRSPVVRDICRWCCPLVCLDAGYLKYPSTPASCGMAVLQRVSIELTLPDLKLQNRAKALP
jgi:hypothetical protein